jgi:hypothetical protein
MLVAGSVDTIVTTVCTTEPSPSVVADVSITVDGGGVLSTRTDVVSVAAEEDCAGDVDVVGWVPPSLQSVANSVAVGSVSVIGTVTTIGTCAPWPPPVN